MFGTVIPQHTCPAQGSVLLLVAIAQNLFSIPHLELSVLPATVRSRQIFRLVEMAQSPSEAGWCTHQFWGVLPVYGQEQHDGYVQT